MKSRESILGRWAIGAVVSGLLASAAPAALAAVGIDDFATDQGPNSVPGTASSTADGGMLGGERDLSVLRSSGSGTVTAHVLGGELSFTAPTATAGELLLTWDGNDDDALALDPTGISPAADLRDGGTQGGLRLRVEEAEAGTSLVITIYEDATHVSRVGRVLPAIASFLDLFVSFDELVTAPGASGPADLTSVGAVTVRLGGSDSATPPTARISQFDTAPPAVAALKVDRTSGGQTIPPGQIHPGDQIRYRVTVSNAGGGAEGVDLQDILDSNLGLVGGSVRTTPVARRDQYRTLTGTPINTEVGPLPTLLANDSDFDGDPLAAVAATGQVTSQGGSVDVEADGDFVYTPPSGFQGVDSFPYTLQATAGDPSVNASGNPIGVIGSTAYLVIDRVPPIVTAGGTLAYFENDPPTAIDSGIVVTDIDSANLAGAQAAISASYAMGEDLLSFTNTPQIAGLFVPGTGVLTLTGSDTVANYQAALRAVRYENTSESPATAARTVTWTATDGVEASAPATSAINVVSVNDPPTITTTAGATNFTEDGGPVVVDGGLTLSDLDDINLDSATVALVSAPNGGLETLGVANPGASCPGLAVTPGNPLTITGGALVATYQTCLRNVSYNNTSQDPNTTDRTVNFQAFDGTDSSSLAPKTVTVTAVNDPPVADDDLFDYIGNTELRVDLAPVATPHTPETTPSTFGVVDGDADPVEGDAVAVSAITVGSCTDSSAPFDCTDPTVGTVHMQASGRFSYEPAPGDTGAAPTGCAAGALDKESFQYTLTDDGTPSPASDTATVTLCRFQRVWYVDNDSGAGNGTSASPFNTLALLNGAGGAGDSDGPNDWIFVHFGDGTATGQSAGLVLEGGQHLLGEHAGLSIPVSLNGNGSPTVLHAETPGDRPLINHSGAGNSALSATDVIPIEIVGLSLMSVNANAIDLTHAVALPAGPLNTLSIQNNLIRGAGAEGIDINLNAGTTGTLVLGITGTSWNASGTHTGNAVDVDRAAGTLQLNFSGNTNIVSAATAVNIVGGAASNTFLTGFSSNTVHQNTGGSGILVSNATFDGTPGAPYNQVSGGTTVVGVPGDGVGGAAMILSSVAGDLAFTDLDLFASGGTGLGLSGTGPVNVGAGTGTRVTVAAIAATINATGGPAVDINNATIDLQLLGMTSSGSLTTGVSLVNVADAANPGFPAIFSVPSGSSITTAAAATGPSFNISGGNAGISYAGTISYPSGAGRVVGLDGWSGDDAGDDLLLSGAISSGTSPGVDGGGILVNNSGGSRSITFSGGINIFTTGSAATDETFAATSNTNSGNLHVTGTNILESRSATALRVTSTDIGASHLTFRSVSSGNNTAGADPVNGIVLDSTGAVGSLRVQGTGSANSGGTVQFTSGAAVVLTGTLHPQFSWMNLHDIGRSGVDGFGVTNFTFNNSSVSNVGTAAAGQYEESNIAFNDVGSFTTSALSGTVSITNNSLTNARRHGIQIENGTGTIASLTISNNTLTSSTSAVASLGHGILVAIQGSAATTAHLTTATISNNTISFFPNGSGIQIAGGSGNAANGTSATLGANGTPIAVTGNFIGGNAATKMGQNAIIVSFNGQSGISNFNISSNGTVGTPLSHFEGIGVSVFMGGTVTGSTTVNSNVIASQQTIGAGSAGIGVQADDGPAGLATSAPNVNFTINGNNVSQNEGFGIRAFARASLAVMDVTIQNNTVTAPILANRNGIRVDSGSAAGDVTTCLAISGNTSDGSGVNAGIGIRKQGNLVGTNDFGIVGLAPSPTTGANAAAKVTADNPLGGGTDHISGDNFVNCSITP